MANPDKDIIAFVGDGSFVIQSSIYSSVITNNKLIIIVCIMEVMQL